MIPVSLGIIHAAHAPERAAMLERLAVDLTPLPRWLAAQRVHGERESPRDWARRAWRWAVSTDATFHVIINDDVRLAPMFWPALAAMLAAMPDDAVLGLGTVSPGQRDACKRGERWLRDGHGVVGWAYGMFTWQLELLLEREAALPAAHRSPGHDECKPGCEYWHEDSWMNATLAELQLAVWHPIPSIVDHDTSIPSLYGNDHHKHRTAPVTWREYDLTSPEFWKS